ncbi:reverse transcriptase domain-containing protein [Tanacetum coccineum]
MDGPARGWLDRLPNGCIDNWVDLREAFVERFALRRKYCKDPTKVSKIIKKTNETLPDFKQRWTEEMSYIPDVPIVMQISSFMSNSKCPELARRFSDQVPKTVTEMMKRVDDFVKSDERKSTTSPLIWEWTLEDRHSPRRDHYQPYVSPRAPDRRYDNRRHDHRRQKVNHLRLDSLTKLPSEILAMELQLQLPPCPSTVAPPKKENLDRYYEYHGEKGHYTNDCFHLKKQLEVALESGKLNHLIKNVRQRGNNRGRPARNNNGRGKVINTVQRKGKELKYGPLIVEAEVEGYWVRMVFVDQGAEPSDMAGIPKWLIRHTLNVNNSVSPVAQKRRVLGTEKSRVVTKEVEE